PGTPDPPVFPDAETATAWCSRHYEALSGAVEIAAAFGRPDIAPRIAVELMAYAITDVSRDWGSCLEHALRVAQDHGDTRAEAWVRHRMGVFHGLWQRTAECLSFLESALALHQATDDRLGESLALRNLSSGYNLARQYELALAYGQRALDHFAESPQTDLNHPERGVLLVISHALLELGRYEQAANHLKHALTLFDPDADLSNRSFCLTTLGAAYQGLGRFDEAVTAIEEAVELSLRANNEHRRADCLHTLGRVYHHFGHTARARDYWQQAMAIFKELEFAPGADQVAADLAALDG
ncbi:tetratricopeptide repeat protein, partial [Catenulispora rubra]|uniref:tetratricopeptide repeat protein n=1 Tax=Catenulispora rubra TaxID=280293 RepID=UPI001E293E21